MRGILWAALAGLVVVAGCTTDERMPTYRDFDNRTGQTVTVVWERGGGERVTHATLAPGETAYVTMNDFGDPRQVCGEGDEVALDLAGRELIRRPASCGSVWIIRVPAVPTDRITDRTWTLTALVWADGAQTAPAVPSTVRLASSGDLTFRTGCRTLAGRWATVADEVAPTTLLVADESAAAPCAGQAARQDADVTAILSTPDAVQVVGSSLVLIANAGDHRDWQLRYELAAGQP
jgi:hypothetical protein